MSGMADEMARRLADDQGAGLPDGQPAGVVPGNEGRQPDPAAPPAGESNADTPPDSGHPDTIPYARFKEVNDRLSELRPYEELGTYGYDADSLRRLAAFETGYIQDPVGTLKAMATNLDLPPHIIAALEAHEASLAGASGQAQGEPEAGDQQPPALSPEVQSRLDYVDQLRAERDSAAQEAQLQSVVEAWDKLDEAEGIKTPERAKLMAIAQTAQQGGSWTTYEELAKAAREPLNELRAEALGSAVQGTGRGGTPPPSLPGSTPAGAGPVKFDSFRSASRAAEAAIARGELPALK